MHRWTATWGMLVVVAGCGRAETVKVAPVAGVVRYNGIPVRDAYVKFSQKGSPIIAGGFTDDTGRFELTSYESGDGAPVGENAVTIAVAGAPEAETDESQAAAEAIADPAERKKEVAEAARRRKTARAGANSQAAEPRSRIPRKYALEETSKLSFVVEAGVENECEFDLTD